MYIFVNVLASLFVGSELPFCNAGVLAGALILLNSHDKSRLNRGELTTGPSGLQSGYRETGIGVET